MKKQGTVIEIKNGCATVECERESACAMCENAASCAEKCEKVLITLPNSAGAVVGDCVEIEAKNGYVLGNAFAVFFVPVLIAIAVYFISDRFFYVTVSSVLTLISLVLSAIIIAVAADKKAKKRNTNRIVRIL